MTRLLTVFLISSLGWVSAAEGVEEDPLPRRGFLGAQLMEVPPEWRDELKLEPGIGAIIAGILPGTAASLLDVREYDVLVRVGDLEVVGSDVLPEIISTISRHRDGDVLPFTFLRFGKEITKDIRLMGMRKETSNSIDVLYSALKVGPIWRRTIVTKPKGDGPFPVVVYYQSYGCDSLDQPYTTRHNARHFAHSLADVGVAVIRIEKSGVGDSEGLPCIECGYEEEYAAYDVAVPYAKGLSFVDPDDVHVFGHGTGGVSAARVAAKYDVASVMVYGTYCRPLREHLELNEIRFLDVSGASNSRTEQTLAKAERFLTLMLDEGQHPTDILFEHRDLESYVEMREGDDIRFFGVDHRYWRQLSDIDVEALWAEVDEPVLALWGDSDYVSGPEDHQRIVDIVNRKDAGRGLFRTVFSIGHAFDAAPSVNDSFADRMRGPMNPGIVREVENWVKGRLR